MGFTYIYANRMVSKIIFISKVLSILAGGRGSLETVHKLGSRYVG